MSLRSPSPSDRDRRRLLKALPAAAAAFGLGRPGPVGAMAAEPTAALLKARLAEQGTGLVALQVDKSKVEIVAQGRAAEGTALRDDALLEIGSITKTFTGLLLADAVVRRRLALDDPVEGALPGIKLRDSAGAPIRWVDLATHRSGLPRLPANIAPRDPADPYADYDEARLLAYLREFKPTVARDTRWEYSNLGFGLLGYALGRAAGSSYPAQLDERVLRPLGMTRSTLSLPGRALAGLVDGHDADKRRVPHWHLDVLAGAGGLVMPAADLARYAQAALAPDSTPLGEAFLLAQKRHAVGPSEMNPIGLAWLRAPLNGRTVLNHDGGTAGFSSSLWLDPQRQRATAVIANAMVEVNDLALHLLDESMPAKDLSLMRQAAVALGAEQLAPLAGVYATRPAFKLTLSVRDGQLWAQATGQGAFQLFARSPRRFFARITPLEIEFAEGSPPASLTLLQGGATLRFVRE
ncbi:MAG: beta-lactamase family protein [Burkholderiales bacterium]|nr:beta-lactamase family protein [Burkholderiales bacterium]